MNSGDMNMYTMPAFDRVRENFLKRVEDDIKSNSASSAHGASKDTKSARNLFIRNITSLGYSHIPVESAIADLCSADSTNLDGDKRTLDFIWKLFKELIKVTKSQYLFVYCNINI
jgi:hypothetical protein